MNVALAQTFSDRWNDVEVPPAGHEKTAYGKVRSWREQSQRNSLVTPVGDRAFAPVLPPIAPQEQVKAQVESAIIPSEEAANIDRKEWAVLPILPEQFRALEDAEVKYCELLKVGLQQKIGMALSHESLEPFMPILRAPIEGLPGNRWQMLRAFYIVHIYATAHAATLDSFIAPSVQGIQEFLKWMGVQSDDVIRATYDKLPKMIDKIKGIE